MRKVLVCALVGVVLLITLGPARALDASWTTTYPLRQQTRAYLSLFEDGTGFALQAGGGSLSFLRSQDGGTTWALLPDPPGVGTPKMDFASERVGYLAASDDVFKTVDGGETWAPIAPPTSDFVAWGALSTAQGGRTIALTGSRWGDPEGGAWEEGECHDPRNDLVVSYVSSNAGKSWTKGSVYDGPSGTFHADFVNARHGVLTLDSEMTYEQTDDCGFSGSGELGQSIMVTHDGGRHWDEALVCPEPAGCQAVAMVSAKHFATVTSDARVIVTFDGGKTYTTTWLDGVVEVPTVREHIRWAQGISFGDRNVGYVSTNGRGIWRTADGGLTWEREVSPHELPGYSFGTVAAAGDSEAIAGGPNFLIRRLP